MKNLKAQMHALVKKWVGRDLIGLHQKEVSLGIFIPLTDKIGLNLLEMK